MATATCGNCGSAVDAAAKFCPECGAGVGAAPAAAGPPGTVPPGTVPPGTVPAEPPEKWRGPPPTGAVPPPAAKRSRGRGCLTALAVMAGLVVVMIVVVAVVAGSKSSNSKSAAQKTCASFSYPDHQGNDHCGQSGQTVEDFGLTMTAANIRRATTDPILGPEICADVSYVNRSTSTKDFDEFDWKLQTPSGVVQSFEITDATLGSGQVVAGGNKSGTVCFKDNGEKGQFVLIWKPDPLRSDRGIWLFQF